MQRFHCRANRGSRTPRIIALVLSLAAGAIAQAASRGTCDGLAEVTEYTPGQVDQMVAGLGLEAQLYTPAACGVRLYRLTYSTIAPDGTLTPASGGMAVPTGCGEGSPLVAFQHGTWTTTNLSMADPALRTVQEVMAQYAAQGYAVVMPDYLGYDASTLYYHPYLQADSAADVSMDAVRAVRNCLAGQGMLGQELFIAGISEGGYVAMATLRAMEALANGEFDVTATVSASGPYALAASTMSMIEDNDGIPGYAWMQLVGYQDTYGDVYHETTDVFQEPWAGEQGFETLLPNEQTLSELTHEGRLPQNLEGSNGLLSGAFVMRYKRNPSEPARLHTQQNDLLDFVPKSPLSMCYGWPDPHARQNAQLAYQWFASQGVQTELGDIQLMVQYLPFIVGMGHRNYHADIEAPVCMAWSRQHVFDPHRQVREHR